MHVCVDDHRPQWLRESVRCADWLYLRLGALFVKLYQVTSLLMLRILSHSLHSA